MIDIARQLAITTLSRLGGVTDRLGTRCHNGARVARFLRGRLEFSGRPDDVFISSYPRSGTTWLQQLLLVLARDGDPGFAHISDEVPWFERSLALGTHRADAFESLQSPRIFKSHLPLQWLPAGARYVYTVRDGRDVAVSYYHLYRSHLRYADDFDSFFQRFVRGDLQYRSWFKHTAGWRAAADRPDVRIVEYERMLSDLPSVMGALNDFLGFERSRERLTTLAPLCSFDYMKAREHRYDHATEERALRGMETGAFLRRGTTGGFSDYLNGEQMHAFDVMEEQAARHPRLELNLSAFLH